ncbi:hypothetical protein QBC35DRAFT_410530 [Podospora australis]|uniref:Large ribosomal subunit protein mL50 n=1 Tax=Podospora australis TaxID=1536484 RepID=A0AAN6WVU3_9PEZI|nr:hypothetical protein QBC35DRAFT_410530 [Podospora australis]
MRNVSRLRSVVSSGLCPSSAPIRSTAPVATTFSTTSPTPSLWQTQTRCLSSTNVRSARAKPGKNKLVVPQYHLQTAVPSTEVSDPEYKPAEDGLGLEEVGGLDGWWDDANHWNPDLTYTGYGPTEKVTDPAVLETVVRRAVVEALVLRRFAAGADKKIVNFILESDTLPRKFLRKVLKTPLIASETDGAVTLEEEVHKRAWHLLRGFAGTSFGVKGSQPESTEAEEGILSHFTSEEATALAKGWGHAWKKAKLKDDVVKFYAAKRIQKLTGHIIPDAKMINITTVGALLTQIATPPKPKKLVELVEQKALFQELPNVRVFPRRVTPIDKEKMVGRWKLIQQELEDRGLPVTGTAGYGKAVEKRWAAVEMLGIPGLCEGRTDRLRGIVEGLKKDDVDSLAVVAEKSADAARDASWRLPIGESGLLELVLSAIPASDQHPLNKQALRLIGNACADCDENRARVVASGKLSTTVIEYMSQDVLLPFAIAATLNSCVDYEPAQSQVSQAGLSKVLIDLVSGDRLSQCESSLSHIMTILEMLSNQDSEKRIANPETPYLLLKLATCHKYDEDLEAFLEIVTPALAYLTHQELQAKFIEGGAGIYELQRVAWMLAEVFNTTELDSDTADQLKQFWAAFVTIVADISALPEFAEKYSLSSTAAKTFVSWLFLKPTASDSHRQVAACLALGNLARSDETSQEILPLVQDSLVAILRRAIPQQPPLPRPEIPSLQLIHASLAFLKNLAIPAASRPILGAALLSPPEDSLLSQLWTSTSTQPQLQFTSVSLTRLLLVNTSSNAKLICRPTPVSSSAVKMASPLILVAETAFQADDEPIKMEAARIVSNICRTLHSSSDSNGPVLDSSDLWSAGDEHVEEQGDDSLDRFYTAHSSIIKTSFNLLLTQKRFPPVRSDAIFILAFMARSAQGARMALRVLEDSNTCRALVQAITGDDELAKEYLDSGVVSEEKGEGTTAEGVEVKQESVSGLMDGLSLEPQSADAETKKQPARMVKVDRENGLVLVADLLRNPGSDMPSSRKQLFEAVINKGSELLVEDRKEAEANIA